MKMQFNYAYDIGDRVYHATPDSDVGIVTDITYSVRNNQAKYEIVFGRRNEDNVFCFEEELSRDKIF